jgi:ubiquinone/menaquinone biosynthesis C-methylase UbiE
MSSGCARLHVLATPAGEGPIRQEKYSDSNPVVRFVIGRFFDRIRTLLADLGPRSLLDAGSGEGELLDRGVFPCGITPVLLDLRSGSLADLRQRTGQANLVCGSVRALPFPSRSFDAVLCLEVLEHLEDPASAVRELSRVARKAVILSVPYEPYFRIGNVMRGKHLRHLGNFPEHVQHWNMRTFGKFLSSVLTEIRLIEAFPWIVACCRPEFL